MLCFYILWAIWAAPQKCIQAFSFELTPLLKKYWTLIQKVYSTFICQYKIFNFNLIFEAWISKHTIVQHQSRVCLYWNEFHGIDVRIPEHSATSAAFSSGLWGPHVRHPTLNRAPLINGPLVDRQFPPLLQGVELRSRGAELSVRGDSLLWAWPGRTAGRQPAVSAPRLAHNWANRDHNFFLLKTEQITFYTLLYKTLVHWCNATRSFKHRNRGKNSWKYREPCFWAGCAGVGRAGGLRAVLSLPALQRLYSGHRVTTGLALPHSLSSDNTNTD